PFVEINVNEKELTDKGFDEFIGVLIKCIKFKDDEHPLGRTRVTELHLQGNQLTLESLSQLAEVVALSAGDLRELDLSQNKIQIETAEDIEQWVSFLKAFENCFVLKKLDLGGNPLGRLGLEHFARVYLKSGLDFLEDDADALLGSELADECSPVETVAKSGKENEPKHLKKKSPHKGKGARQSSHTHVDPTGIKKHACTRGLRSIPYLVLSDIGLSSTGALHLMSMLNVQRTREQLLKYLPSGKPKGLPGSEALCKSIIWRPNDTLDAHTQRLLEVSEALRDMKSDSDSEEEDVNDEDDAEKTAQNKLQNDLKGEYSRKSKRVRLQALKEDGVHGSTIWGTALKMMLVSRVILLDGQEHPKEVSEAQDDKGKNERDDEGDNDSEGANEDSSETPTFSHIENRATGPFHPSAQAFNFDFPTLQEAHEPFVSEGAASQDEAKNPPSGEQTPHQSSLALRAARKLPRDLPFDLLRRVIAEAVGADGILDHDQQERIIEYGASWQALANELKFQGAEEHQQIWKLLDTLKCFEYT
ncbi:hypothetical protein BO94DRAFT_446026, partial [Aspergillus sclerotioniger CBS 115572]